MNRKRIAVVVMYLCLVTIASVSADENLRVLPETIDGVAANKIMGHYLRKQAALQFEYWTQQAADWAFMARLASLLLEASETG